MGGLREEVIRLREAHAAAPAASPPPPVLPKLPMETEEDVAALEAFLAEESNFEYMVGLQFYYNEWYLPKVRELIKVESFSNQSFRLFYT